MKKIILFLMLIILSGFLSCYDDGLGDTYDDDAGYRIGDVGPAGGWIFYINPNYRTDGWRYLEAAPYDQSTSAPMAPSSLSIPVLTGLGRGYGDVNTARIIAAAGNTGIYAAKLCADLIIGGYDDWYLPTDAELDKMNVNLHHNGIGNFANGQYYWSSRYGWGPPATFYNLMFTDGSTGNGSYFYQYFLVRAVRYF